MTISNIARVTEWNDEKGYGFAIANGKKYFVHKSALGPVTRNPVKGDTIAVMQFLETPKGSRIASGVLEGVPLKQVSRESRSTYVPGYYRRRKLRMALGIALIAGPITLLMQCKGAPEKVAEPSPIVAPVESAPEPFREPFYEDSPTDNSSNYHCDGRTHCSQMKSYEEAVFFLHNCPNVQMDGDGDGIPCERQFGR